MDIKGRKQEKIDSVKQLFDDKDIDKKLHDRAIKLTESHNPWYWKKTNSGRITGIVDIFDGIKKEREKKNKRKRKKK